MLISPILRKTRCLFQSFVQILTKQQYLSDTLPLVRTHSARIHSLLHNAYRCIIFFFSNIKFLLFTLHLDHSLLLLFSQSHPTNPSPNCLHPVSSEKGGFGYHHGTFSHSRTRHIISPCGPTRPSR